MIITACTFLAFAILHSITAADWFKQRCRSLFGDAFVQVWYRLLYTILSAVTISMAFFFMASIPDHAVMTVPPWCYWPMQGFRVLGLVLCVRAFEYLDVREFLGARQVVRYLFESKITGNIEGLTGSGLITKGVYGIVRHPIYLGAMMIVTCDPIVTINGLAFTMLADAYFLFGIILEERRFLAEFGDEYVTYKKKVPMLVPRLFPTRQCER